MKFEAQYLIDYTTLFTNHEILSGFHDCLLIVPYSNFKIFIDMVTELLNDSECNAEEKAYIKNLYQPFCDIVFSNETIIKQITEDNRDLSDAICLSLLDNLYMSFSGSSYNPELQLSEEVMNTIDIFTYDCLSASEKFSAPIFTTSEDLVNVIQTNDILVEYITPQFDEE